MTLLIAEDLRKTYPGGTAPVEALRGVDLRIEPGEFVAIMGPSGCGKSTLLHLCGAMDRPTGGRLLFEDAPLVDLDDERLTELRRRRIGFVFQLFNLLTNLTVIENVALPLLLAGNSWREARDRAGAIVEQVGLAHRRDAYPQQLSGGELQRTAIGRAIVHGPALVVADEPTGNLDSDNGAMVLELLSGLHRAQGVTILLATHAHDVAAAADRVLHMRDGRILDSADSRPQP